MQTDSDKKINFLTPLSVIPGFGPKRIVACKEAGIETIGDLLYHLPFKCLDRSTIVPLAQISQHVNQECTVSGTITRAHLERGRKTRLRVQITDETGDSLELLWFAGVSFLKDLYRNGVRMLVTGKPTVYKKICMAHPVCEILSTEPDAKTASAFLPCYRVPEAMRRAFVSQSLLRKSIAWLLKQELHFPHILPPPLETRLGFPPLAECLKQLHLPDKPDTTSYYLRRLIYEEIYAHLLLVRFNRKSYAHRGRTLQPGNLVKHFCAQLPFTLTTAQSKALDVLLGDAAGATRMHRLLHGDVGCGKTVVAAAACLPALNEKFSVAWLAPTELLARQTFERLQTWFIALKIPCVLLTATQARTKAQEVAAALQDTRPKLIIGTHALLQERHDLQQVGMIVIDEQHRFGVRQRLSLQQRFPAADVLLMSATPIPQTLAATLYGDLDCVTIDASPAGRTPVRTHLVPLHKRADMERFILEQITTGAAQVYYIAPRIEPDDEADPLISDVTTVAEKLKRGLFVKTPLACIHGECTAQKQQEIMDRFRKGACKMLVATTIVEVGVDVPAATIMVIENAERFGLAQLHQLRGRVGRGSAQGYCFLLSGDTLQAITQERLEYFCTHHDGFALADKDLSLRGPGEVSGIHQSGLDDLRFADIMRDAPLFHEILQDLNRSA